MTARVAAANLRLKRAYEATEPGDGVRILVDRLWPRGVSKAAARLDRWMKDIAPSTGLRQWFGHDPKRWPEFRRRYVGELKEHAALLREIISAARRGVVTLVYSAHDEIHNDAVALRNVLLGRRG